MLKSGQNQILLKLAAAQRRCSSRTPCAQKPRAPWRLLVSLVALATSIFPLNAQASERGETHRVPFTQGLGWVTSGVWSEDGEILLVTDVIRGEIMSISPQGELAAVSDPGGILLSTASGSQQVQPRPSQIRSSGAAFFVEDEAADKVHQLGPFLEWQGSSLVKHRKFARGTVAAGGEAELLAIYDWSPLGVGLLAFADLQGVGGYDWQQRSFLYFDDTDQQVFYSIAANAPVRHLYTKGNLPYIAILEDAGYILLMHEKPVIGEVRVGFGGIRELQFFPEEFQERPNLEASSEWMRPLPGAGGRRATAFFKVFEQSQAAVGLYARGGYLFLLAKTAMNKDKSTDWWLIKLAPRDDGRELSRVRLPTDAAHLTVVPGENSWAFIEKGPVEGIGKSYAPYMKTDSMVLVPAAWAEGRR